MKKITILTVALVAAIGMISAIAIDRPTTDVSASHTAFISTDAASIAAITVPGQVPGGIAFGTYVSGGDDISGTAPPNAWDFALDGVFDSTAANAPDYHWVHATTTPIIWDFNGGADTVFVLPSVDHPVMFPAPYEALEFTVWGSNDPDAPFPGSWTLASLGAVYADGWADVGAIEESDDFASSWTWGGSAFRYGAVYADRSIEIEPWLPFVNACVAEGVWCSDDYEIDAVGAFLVPGCTPGYWKNHVGSWGPTGLNTSDDFETLIGTSPQPFDDDPTMLETLRLRGGGIIALSRHASAALLNTLHPDVGYPLSTAEIIAAYQAALTSGENAEIKEITNLLEVFNKAGCSIDAHGDPK